MLNLFKKGLRLSQTPQHQLDEKLLTLEREIQNLRLELTERDQLIDKLKQQLEQQNLSKSERTFRWMKRYISNRSPVKRKIDGKQISHVGRSRLILRRLGKQSSNLSPCSWI